MSAPHFEGTFFGEFIIMTTIQEEKVQSWQRAGPQSVMQPAQH